MAAHTVNQQPRSIFLERLLIITEESETLFPGCCGWNAQGDSFVVHDKFVFETSVLPHYTASSKLKSFSRQMNRHGFFKQPSGSKMIEFRHPNFRRDRPDLVALIRSDQQEKDVGASSLSCRHHIPQMLLPLVDIAPRYSHNEERHASSSSDASRTQPNYLPVSSSLSSSELQHRLMLEQLPVQQYMPPPPSSMSQFKEGGGEQRGDVWSFQQPPSHLHHQHLQYQHPQQQHPQQDQLQQQQVHWQKQQQLQQEQPSQNSPPQPVPPLATKLQKPSFGSENNREGFSVFETINEISMRLDQRVILIEDLRKQITDLESENAWMWEQTKAPPICDTAYYPLPTQPSSSSSNEESLRLTEGRVSRTDPTPNFFVRAVSADDCVPPPPPPPQSSVLGVSYDGLVDEKNGFSYHHPAPPTRHLNNDHVILQQQQQQQQQQQDQLQCHRQQEQQQRHLQQLEQPQQHQQYQQWLDATLSSPPAARGADGLCVGVKREVAEVDDGGAERQEHGDDGDDDDSGNDEQATAPKMARLMHPPSSSSSYADPLLARTDSLTQDFHGPTHHHRTGRGSGTAVGLTETPLAFKSEVHPTELNRQASVSPPCSSRPTLKVPRARSTEPAFSSGLRRSATSESIRQSSSFDYLVAAAEVTSTSEGDLS